MYETIDTLREFDPKYINITTHRSEYVYKDYLNPESVVVRKGCKLEESLKDAKPGEKFQFVRTGFFTPDSKNPGVYNRVVTLRDSFKPAK